MQSVNDGEAGLKLESKIWSYRLCVFIFVHFGNLKQIHSTKQL